MNRMRIARVKYTVRTTGSDGKTISENKNRVLSELESTEPEYIQQVLEQVVRAPEQPEGRNNTVSSSLVVANITELKPTGDDDQM